MTKTKLIYTPYVARRLVRDFHEKIVDIKPNKENRDKTIFVFEVSDTFADSMAKASIHEKDGDEKKEYANE